MIKEVGAGLYSIPMYYMCRMLSELMGSLIPAIINGLAVIFLTGIDLEFKHFILFSKCLVIKWEYILLWPLKDTFLECFSEFFAKMRLLQLTYFLWS